MLTTLLIFSLFFVSTYTTYQRSTTRRVQNYNRTLVQDMVKNIDAYFSQLQNIANAIAFNDDFQSSILAAKRSAYYKEQANTLFDSLLRMFYFAYPDVQMTFFFENSPEEIISLSSVEQPGYRFQEDAWYARIKETGARRLILLDNSQAYFKKSYRKSVVSVVYQIPSITTGAAIGYILMDIDHPSLMAYFRSEHVGVTTTTLLTDDNEIVFSNARTPPDFGQTGVSGYYDDVVDGERVMVIYDTSRSTGWRILNTVSYHELARDLRDSLRSQLLTAALLVLLALIISYVITHMFKRPINLLLQGIDKVKRGDLSVSLPEYGGDELGDLIRHFNGMVQRINGLIHENQSMEILRRDAQLMTLQQQVNPHFLYNSLELIIGAASEHETKTVTEICQSMGHMLRYNLELSTVETIAQEMNQVDNYLVVMCHRFEGRFHVETDIKPDLLGQQIPKMTLQPLVENAILHGFEDKLSDCLIRIEITRAEDGIHLVVSDNGRGMDAETRRKLTDCFSAGLLGYDDIIRRKQSFGLPNVYLRLRLHFGDRLGFTIDSAPGEGFRVSIVLPVLSAPADGRRGYPER